MKAQTLTRRFSWRGPHSIRYCGKNPGLRRPNDGYLLAVSPLIEIRKYKGTSSCRMRKRTCRQYALSLDCQLHAGWEEEIWCWPRTSSPWRRWERNWIREKRGGLYTRLIPFGWSLGWSRAFPPRSCRQGKEQQPPARVSIPSHGYGAKLNSPLASQNLVSWSSINFQVQEGLYEIKQATSENPVWKWRIKGALNQNNTHYHFF